MILFSDDAAAGELARANEALTEGYYARLDGEGPVQPRWSRRTPSTYTVFAFADGVVQRVLIHERSKVAEERVYDILGYPSLTIRWGDPWPEQVLVHLADPVTVPMAEWGLVDLAGGAQAWLPGGPGNGDAELLGGRLRHWMAPTADVAADAWLTEQLEACGCVLVERHADWVGGRPGVRLRLRTVALDRPDEALLWAVPRPEGTWMAAYTVQAPPDADTALAPGRAVVGLIQWPLED